MRRGRYGVGVLALACALGLAGCGDDDPPTTGTLPSPPASSDASPSGSDEPAATASPSASGGVPASPTSGSTASGEPDYSQEEQEAVETVRAYAAAYEQSYRSGSADRLAALMTEGCPCRAALEEVRQLIQEGQVSGGEVRVITEPTADVRSNGQALVAEVVAETRAEEGLLVRPDGSEALIAPNPPTRDRYSMVRDGDRWIINDIVDVS